MVCDVFLRLMRCVVFRFEPMETIIGSQEFKDFVPNLNGTFGTKKGPLDEVESYQLSLSTDPRNSQMATKDCCQRILSRVNTIYPRSCSGTFRSRGRAWILKVSSIQP